MGRALKKITKPEHGFKLYDEFFENFTSKHTRTSYRTDIDQFLRFLNLDHGVDTYPDVERIHVIKYRNWLQDCGGRWGDACAPKTVARKLASISSYFDFLVEKGKADSNPATSVKRPRREVLSPTNALSGDQVRELFLAIDENTRSGPLHKALLITFFTTGLRKSEVLQMKYKDYKPLNDHKILEFKGKGGKVGQKLLHPICIEALDQYIQWMSDQERAHRSGHWMFQPTRNPSDPNNLNKPLNPKTINEILEQYGRKIGLNFSISPHSARATFISELLELGVDIYTVAREVNHSSVTTTQEYDKRRKKLLDSPVLKLKY
jgi:site-specific recombinase XerD